jgi:thiol-disulfide isomerase/thioredoxin
MNDQSAARPRGRVLTWALWGVAAIGVAAVVYIIAQATTKPAPQAPVAASGAVPTASETHDVAKKLEHTADGTAPPAYAFVDAAGKKVTPADFKGKVVVMNLWATWCAPCKIEMPTLAKLAKAYEGKPVAVVAVSIDNAEALEQAKAFLAQQTPLTFYNDPQAKLPWALKPAANGMPTTVILGKDGLERGRISGEADWSGAGARSVIDKLLAAG